jgi:hypothetical protein
VKLCLPDLSVRILCALTEAGIQKGEIAELRPG